MWQKTQMTWFFILVTFITIETFKPNKADASLIDGLISAWTFDNGDALDFFGSNHGAIKGGVVPTVNGKFGPAMDFNGVDGYIEVPSSASLEQTQAFTISAWVNIREAKDHSAIVWKGEKIGWGPNYLFRIGTTSNTDLVWGVCWDKTEGGFATVDVITPNEWHFVGLTVNGRQAVVYVAGGSNVTIFTREPALAPYLTFPDQPLEIGRGVGINDEPDNVQYLEGFIDEVYFWKRALSVAELQQAADEGLHGAAVAVEPVGKLATVWGAVKRR